MSLRKPLVIDVNSRKAILPPGDSLSSEIIQDSWEGQLAQAKALIVTQTEIVENHAWTYEDSANVQYGAETVKTKLDSLDFVVAAIQPQLVGKQSFHGFVNRTSSTLAFDNSTHIFTLGVATAAVVYLNGVAYTISSPGLTIDLDTKTLSNGLWFIWIEISGGVAVLNASKTAWNILDLLVTPCATVYWNGSAGAIGEERHGYDRNLQDHLYKHLTIGSRIQNDGSFAQIRPTTAFDGQIELVAGYLWDEDIPNPISTEQSKLVRNWYETSAGVWTFADGVNNAGYDRPYIWNGATSRLQYPRTTSAYALTDSASNTFIPVWLFASNDVIRPIYAVIPSLSAGYTTVALARAALQPNLPFAPELKLLYSWIYSGDGEYQEATDYRTSASLPGGGVTSPSALSVSFSPTGDLNSLNVQAALEELDIEKQPLLVSGTNIKTINGTTLLGSGDVVISGTISAVKSFFMTGW